VKIFLTLTTLFISTSLAWAERFEVRVAEKSTVRVGEPVRLGNLIVGKIQDAELSSRIYNLVVFDAITSEEEKSFKSDQLALMLRQKLSFQDLQRLSMKIPDMVKVRAQRNYLHAGDLMREISDQAKVLCTGCTIEFDDLKVPDLKIREEVLQTHLEVQNLKSAGSFLLPLQVETSQGKSVYWVTGRLAFYKEAPVAKRMIRAGERISDGDVEVKKINVSFAKDGAPTLEELAGKISTRMITMGQPILAGDLKKEPAATRGQAVRILVGNDSFEVVSSGTAEESGSIGDVIRVKSTDTQKLLSGVLVDKATVRVQ
jgi:flagellar basal body P-ring formation protein FlgA